MLCYVPRPLRPSSFQPLPASSEKCQIKLEQAHDYYTWTKWVNCQTGFNGFETVFSIAISERRAETNETLTIAIETGVKGFFFSKPSRNASRKKKFLKTNFPAGDAQIPIDS